MTNTRYTRSLASGSIVSQDSAESAGVIGIPTLQKKQTAGEPGMVLIATEPGDLDNHRHIDLSVKVAGIQPVWLIF